VPDSRCAERGANQQNLRLDNPIKPINPVPTINKLEGSGVLTLDDFTVMLASVVVVLISLKFESRRITFTKSIEVVPGASPLAPLIPSRGIVDLELQKVHLPFRSSQLSFLPICTFLGLVDAWTTSLPSIRPPEASIHDHRRVYPGKCIVVSVLQDC
jgi:hypothetical protein